MEKDTDIDKKKYSDLEVYQEIVERRIWSQLNTKNKEHMKNGKSVRLEHREEIAIGY